MSVGGHESKRILVTGAGGFIGSHLVCYLKKLGHFVRGVDIVRPRWLASLADEFWLLDLRNKNNAINATRHIDWVFHLAANMGGIGFISYMHADIIRDNTAINENVIWTAYQNGIERYFFASSACIYPTYRQEESDALPLKEEEAYPADPDGAYGWEKLHGEHLCKYLRDESWIDVRVARFHNVYGKYTDWGDPKDLARIGREKAPAAICRKVAIAKLTGNPEVEIWGDGEQRRSFMYIDDCIEGIYRIMLSDYTRPLNLGRDDSISINQLADLVAEIADIEIEKVHIKGAQGVRGRNSDNSLCKQILDWSPPTALEIGLVSLYEWIEGLVKEALDKGVKF